MQDRYELIEAFPSSLAKYEVGLIAATLEGESFNPCDTLYDKVDHREYESVEDIVENLAFEEQERLQLFLDAKNHYFNSRRVDAIQLVGYLSKEYDYDAPHIREFDDDKNALFLMLFHETYDAEDNSLDDKFHEARVAAHKFKDKRDRMTSVNEVYDFEQAVEGVVEFEELINTGDHPAINCLTYHDESSDELTVLMQQEQNRKKESRFEFREHNQDCGAHPDVTQVERYPIQENAVRMKSVDQGTEVHVYRSVSSWDDTLMRFFTSTIGDDLVDSLEARQSTTAKQIMEDVKEQASDDDDADIAGTQVPKVVNEHVENATENIDEEDTDVSEEFVERRLESLTVTGIHVDGEDSTFEVHSDNSIQSLLGEYEGLASSLSQAVAGAGIDDITMHAHIPDGSGGDGDEIVLENGEWYMSSTKPSQSTLKALEAALK